ncbi:MAG: cyclic nucleotide-binding domain-containing protein [Candidatus Limnocylindrales bacterium]
MTLTRTQTAALLASVDLFAGSSLRTRRAIAGQTVEVEFPAGRPIVRQGEVGNGLFVLVSGAARVVRDGEVLAHLGPGDFFGELSLLDRQPRIASVVADGPTRCLALAAWDLQRVLQAEPSVAVALLRSVAGRLRASAATDHRH